MKRKVVLAFSGGLDTSFCVKYLSNELNLEVHSAIVNTGGFSPEELDAIAQKAKNLGVANHTTLNETQRYYQQCLRYMVYGNVLRNNTYPLSVSAERVFQALAIVNYARSIGADCIAHGSTGAGNDQVRFDLVFQVIAPEMEIITPIRDLKLSRDQEIDYLRQHGVESDWTKAQYSINQGIWGTSVGGKETLTSHLPLPDNAYPTALSQTQPQQVSIGFEKGEIVSLNGKVYSDKVQLISELNAIASSYAIGRDIHVGDTIIGIKGRVGFEAAAPLIIIKAHHALEKHVLTKWQAYWKEQLANWYGMMLHEGQYLDPVMRNIETFLESTQGNVSGTVSVQLQPHHFQILGVESPHDLMSSKFGQYGEMNNTWTGDDVKGFTKIISNQLKIYFQVNS
jgi:argininosuccinate synthase